MPQGKIKTLKPRFGFIAPDDGSEEIHFNPQAVQGEVPFLSLQEGDVVEYEAQETEKGLSATRLETDLPDSLYRFLNPYNFVRWLEPEKFRGTTLETQLLGKAPPPPHDRWVGLSGKIGCELTTKSPLFVSDPVAWYANDADKREKHKSYRFFNVDFGKGPEPVIPASSLRGMIRSVFEAATNSCFAHFDYGSRLSHRLDPGEALKLVPARVIQNDGKWKLQLMLGTANLVAGERPRGDMYAGVIKRYIPISEDGMITPKKGEKAQIVDIGKLKHGDQCYALVKKPKFPRQWVVYGISKSRQELEKMRRSGQDIFKGYLCLTNQNIEKKHKERFFIAETERRRTVKELDLPDEVVHDYELLLKETQEYHKATIGKWKDTKHAHPSMPKVRERKDGKEIYDPAFSHYILKKNYCVRDGDLVYAHLDASRKVRFIAPVAIPRVWYEESVAQELHPDLAKCESYDNLCPACRTFGWIKGLYTREEKNECKERRKRQESNLETSQVMPTSIGRAAQVTAYKGRVRFSHARLVPGQNVNDDNEKTLAILGSPKPTTSRFYLRPIDDNPESKMRQPDREINWDASGMILRGRKFYRHHAQPDANEYLRAGNKRDEQNRTVHNTIPPGTKFSFDLYFENMAPVELGALLWALELDNNLVHRLGFAKPLGFGSVQIKVNELKTTNPMRYANLKDDKYYDIIGSKVSLIKKFRTALAQAYGLKDESEFIQLQNIQDLRSLLNVSQPEVPIHYPRSDVSAQEEGKNFEWFMGNNKQNGPGYLLPLAPDDKQGFPRINKQGKIIR